MSSLISIAIISSSQIGFYLIGNHVLNNFIIKKDSFEKPDSIIKLVYFVSFCTSVTLLELLGCEILDFFPSSLRWFFWELCLIILLFLLIIIVPFLQLEILFFNRSKSSTFPKFLVIIFIFYCWCFYKIGSIFPIIDQSVIPTSISFVQQGISRIGILGITLLALISGYGSVVGPVTFIFIKNVSLEHLESTERNYKYSEKLLKEKKEKFQKFCEERISGKQPCSSTTLNWFLKRVINMNSNDDQDSKTHCAAL